jgi:MinD-like ATPase involved in chromosome partitioning or flagellar assembly
MVRAGVGEMLVAVCSDKGSPGATTTALALAAAWREPAVMVEADPYGGDLAVRMRTDAGTVLAETPTVLTAAAAARTRRDGALATEYAQRVNGQLSVLPGHLVAEQTAGISDWTPLATSLACSSRPVVVDLGRLHAGSPVLPVAAAADVLVIVARAETGAVIRLRERLSRLVPALAARRTSRVRLFPVLVTRERHGQRDLLDLRRVLEGTDAGPLVAGMGCMAWDRSAVARLEAGEYPGGLLARTGLMRTARRTAADLTAAPAGSEPDAARDRAVCAEVLR